MDSRSYSGPSWDNSQEYHDFNDPQIKFDSDKSIELIEEIERSSPSLQEAVSNMKGNHIVASSEQIRTAQRVAEKRQSVVLFLGNLGTYASCSLSVNGDDGDAKALLGQVQSLRARLEASLKPLQIWQIFLGKDQLEEYLKHPIVKDDEFTIKRARLKREALLSLDQEALIKTLEVNGPTAFGNLYDDLSSTIGCKLEIDGTTKTLGLAQASALLEDSNRELRHKAYRAIEDAWRSVAVPCAASLNALAGWRLTLSEKRRKHFLDEPLFDNCITPATLDTMMQTIQDRKSTGQNAVATQARILKIKDYSPWDLFAPFPSDSSQDSRLTFDEAIELIKDAFRTVHPSMADFVQQMINEHWIEGTTGSKKRPGAYCTKFPKSRTPRVYMTYTGGMKDVITLAHELGHAFHNWVMRDIPMAKTRYPMTLAETASILAQTVVNEFLMERAKSDQDKLSGLWTDSRDAEAFLLNIPCRYQFEYKFYERRPEGSLTAFDFEELMNQSWNDWYGDTLSEGNKMFWASKLHFHISSLSFYNFPYSFGYLFSLGVYARRAAMGQDFFESYVKLLRETGEMTAEQLARKHLSVDLEDKQFWDQSIDIVSNKMDQFSSLSKSLGY
ncbi:M3 family oligoendopeptidase [Pseudobacteriovorax antillogorgiicola]|uniref:Oligoendopeptidase F n=1 Tax=Pseudobacteriovorax antillogorgiicola TaxID=1513793 RepID=A0A1Y6B7G5_9BACT|nr:M3 family oligoendopeptidase [Pseudobacteriovorax antillogorgiicola]TCS59433.1 oligoendopeptidase F [Pseudobacteriovorax antillogorgiicola]SME88323.1 oligoendopeptidase F [Pseudobacteriovorax antillogorgiicola]